LVPTGNDDDGDFDIMAVFAVVVVVAVVVGIVAFIIVSVILWAKA